MNEQRRFPWLAVILGIGCLGLVCVGALVVGGGVAYFLIQETATPSVLEPVFTVPVQTLEPTVGLPTIVVPTPGNPPVVGPTLTGNQHLDIKSFYDDFSSKTFGWPEADDGKIVLKYENQAYGFQILEPDYWDWAYIPADFIPYEIWFDVQGLSDPQNGTFGVLCQFQDVDNHYYVEFNLEDNIYWIGQYVDGEDISLIEQNSSGEYWQSTSVLKSPPTSINRIGVSCYLDRITLFINDQWVNEVSVRQPFEQPGAAAFFVYTYEDTDENGYKVLFDNVEVWQPVQ